MLKHVTNKNSKNKNPLLNHEISAPIKCSNEESANKLPDLSQYRESKIVQISGDLQSNNFPEKFDMTNANSEILNRYHPGQFFKAGDQNSQSISAEDDDVKQNKFATGQEILEKMGYTKIFRIE